MLFDLTGKAEHLFRATLPKRWEELPRGFNVRRISNTARSRATNGGIGLSQSREGSGAYGPQSS